MIDDYLRIPKTLLHIIVRQYPSGAQESLWTDDLLCALNCFLELRTPSEEKKNRTLVLRARNLRIKPVIESSSPSNATLRPTAEQQKHTNLFLDQVPPATEVYSAAGGFSSSDAYSFSKTLDQKAMESHFIELRTLD